MNLSDYQRAAARTAPVHLSDADRRLNCALGLVGEAGEFADAVKKLTFHSRAVDAATLVEELGDVCWYLAEAANIEGVRMGYDDHGYLVTDALYLSHQAFLLADMLVRPAAGIEYVVESTWLRIVGVAVAHGIDTPVMLARNIAKLEARYPGEFKGAK